MYQFVANVTTVSEPDKAITGLAARHQPQTFASSVRGGSTGLATLPEKRALGLIVAGEGARWEGRKRRIGEVVERKGGDVKSPNEKNNANEESWSIIFFPPVTSPVPSPLPPPLDDLKIHTKRRREKPGQVNPGRWTDRFVWERKSRMSEPGGRGVDGMATGLGEPARSQKSKVDE